MLGLLAAAVQAPIALPPHAMRLDALLRELSAATGESYRADGPLAGRIEFCSGPPRTAEAIRADLALANTARWDHSGGEWRLEEDRAAVVARERARLAGRIAAVQAAQAKLRAPAKPFDRATAQEILRNMQRVDKAEKEHSNREYTYFQAAEALLPSTATLRRLVAGIDPVVLAGLQKGQVAFSDRPNRLQRPLGSDAPAAIHAAEAAQSLWATVYTEGDSFHTDRNHWYSADPRAHPNPAPPGSLRAIVLAEVQGSSNLRFRLKLYDAKGEAQMEGYLNFDVEPVREGAEVLPTVDPNEPDTPVSEAARAYSAARQGEPNDADRAVFLAPDRTEPLDMLAGEGCRETAKALGKPLTLWLDDALLELNLQKGKGLSPHGWLRSFARRGYEVREGAASIVLVPRRAMGNLNRRLLTSLVQATDRAGFLPFEAAADYAAAEPAMADEQRTRYVEPFVSAVLPKAYAVGRPDWDFLRLYGGFSPVQRETLRKGGTVPWIAVSKPLQAMFVDAMLQSGPNDIRPDYRKPGNARGRDIDQEPSEVLASGVATGDGVTGEGYSMESVMGHDPNSDSPYAYGMASADTLGRAVAARERDPSAEPRDGMPKTLPTAFILGREFSVGFRVPLGTTLVWSKSSYSGEFDLRAKAVPLEGLPAGYLKTYQEALERYRKEPPPNG